MNLQKKMQLKAIEDRIEILEAKLNSPKITKKSTIELYAERAISKLMRYSLSWYNLKEK